jgi:uncharacterized protein (TIGR04255 family)
MGDGSERSADIAGDLPAFGRPPVIEVVLGIEFQPVPNLGAIRLGQLAERWKDRYPVAQELPPLPASPPIGMPGEFPGVFVNVGAPAIRLWVMSTDQSQLIQIQRDRLILNWRHSGNESPYPHYNALRPHFADAYSDLRTFLAEHELGAIHPTSVEVSYVNEVVREGQSPDLAAILRGVASYNHHLGLPLASRVMQVFTANSPENPATLTLTADTPGRKPNGTLITLTYRSAIALGAAQEDIMATMDLGHRDVVVGFTEATTESMHETWGRIS